MSEVRLNYLIIDVFCVRRLFVCMNACTVCICIRILFVKLLPRKIFGAHSSQRKREVKTHNEINSFTYKKKQPQFFLRCHSKSYTNFALPIPFFLSMPRKICIHLSLLRYFETFTVNFSLRKYPHFCLHLKICT